MFRAEGLSFYAPHKKGEAKMKKTVRSDKRWLEAKIINAVLSGMKRNMGDLAH